MVTIKSLRFKYTVTIIVLITNIIFVDKAISCWYDPPQPILRIYFQPQISCPNFAYVSVSGYVKSMGSNGSYGTMESFSNYPAVLGYKQTGSPNAGSRRMLSMNDGHGVIFQCSFFCSNGKICGVASVRYRDVVWKMINNQLVGHIFVSMPSRCCSNPCIPVD